MPVIRPMRSEDLPEVMRIENLAFPQPWSEDFFRDAGQSESWVICSDDGILRGYIMYYTVLDEGEIINFAIDPAFQRRGLGTRLLSQTIKIMQKRNVSRFFLEVRASNIAAQDLYRRFGFVKLGLRKGYYTNPAEDAIIMGNINER